MTSQEAKEFGFVTRINGSQIEFGEIYSTGFVRYGVCSDAPEPPEPDPNRCFRLSNPKMTAAQAISKGFGVFQGEWGDWEGETFHGYGAISI